MILIGPESRQVLLSLTSFSRKTRMISVGPLDYVRSPILDSIGTYSSIELDLIGGITSALLKTGDVTGTVTLESDIGAATVGTGGLTSVLLSVPDPPNAHAPQLQTGNISTVTLTGLGSITSVTMWYETNPLVGTPLAST